MDTAARAYLRATYGGDFQEEEGSVATAAGPASLGGNDPECIERVFCNLGGNTVYFGLSPEVSATNGIPLNPNGGTVSLSVFEDGMLPTREWFAVSPGGASTVYTLKTRRYKSAAAGG